MTITDKFLNLSNDKQELIIDQLVEKVLSSGDKKLLPKDSRS